MATVAKKQLVTVCDLDYLREAVSKVAAICPSRTTMPVLQCVILECLGDEIAVRASNAEVWGEIRVPVIRTYGEWKLAIPGKRLQQILGNASGAEVEIEPAKNGAVIRTARSEFKLPTEDANKWPLLNIEGMKRVASVDCRLMASMVKHADMAADDYDPRYAFKAIRFENWDSELVAMGMDGRVAAIHRATCGPEDFGILVPLGAARSLKRMLPTIGHCQVSHSQSSASFEWETGSLCARQMEGVFPNVRRAYDTLWKYERSISVQLSALFELASQACVLSEEQSKGGVLCFEKGELSLTNETSSVGQGNNSMPISYDGDPFQITLDVTFLRDACRAMVGNESITLGFNKPETPLWLQDDNGFSFLIVPMER